MFPPSLAPHLCTINLEAGSIAGKPLCCQQRPVPRTRREQGVPFCVRAPQMETISLGSVIRSLAAPSPALAKPELEFDAEFVFGSASTDSATSFAVAAGVGASLASFIVRLLLRSTMSGGGGAALEKFRARFAAARPALKIIAAAIMDATTPSLRKRGAHVWQKRLLVQMRHLSRTICSPHAEQKFGLYMMRKLPRREAAH